MTTAVETAAQNHEVITDRTDELVDEQTPPTAGWGATSHGPDGA